KAADVPRGCLVARCVGRLGARSRDRKGTVAAHRYCERAGRLSRRGQPARSPSRGMYFFLFRNVRKHRVVRHKSVRAVSSVTNAFIAVMQSAELRNLTDVYFTQLSIDLLARPLVLMLT